MLSPKRTRFRKAHKGRIHGHAKAGTLLNFGAYGLKAVEPGRITARQIEASRRAITRSMKRAGRVWIRIFPDVPVSQKPAEVRQGKGKGTPEYWACRVKPGADRLRGRRRAGRGRGGRAGAGGRQAADPGAVRAPSGRKGHERMKAADIRQKTADELAEQLRTLRREAFNLRFRRASGQLETTSRIREVRRDIARIQTIINERGRQGAEG